MGMTWRTSSRHLKERMLNIKTEDIYNARVKLIHEAEHGGGRKEVLESDTFALLSFSPEQQECNSYTNNLSMEDLMVGIGALLEIANENACLTCKSILTSMLIKYLNKFEEDVEHGKRENFNEH